MQNRDAILFVKVALVVLFVWSGFVANSQASLILEINKAAMTYRLIGSTTLVPFIGDESDFAQWGNYGAGALGSRTEFDGTIATSSPNALSLTRMRLFDNGVDLILDFGTGGVPQQEIVGNGQVMSYAGATSTQKSYLHSIIGQTLDPRVNLDTDSIQVVGVNAAPEPASLLMWTVCGLGLFSLAGYKQLRKQVGLAKTTNVVV